MTAVGSHYLLPIMTMSTFEAVHYLRMMNEHTTYIPTSMLRLRFTYTVRNYRLLHSEKEEQEQ